MRDNLKMELAQGINEVLPSFCGTIIELTNMMKNEEVDGEAFILTIRSVNEHLDRSGEIIDACIKKYEDTRSTYTSKEKDDFFLLADKFNTVQGDIVNCISNLIEVLVREQLLFEKENITHFRVKLSFDEDTLLTIIDELYKCTKELIGMIDYITE